MPRTPGAAVSRQLKCRDRATPFAALAAASASSVEQRVRSRPPSGPGRRARRASLRRRATRGASRDWRRPRARRASSPRARGTRSPPRTMAERARGPLVELAAASRVDVAEVPDDVRCSGGRAMRSSQGWASGVALPARTSWTRGLACGRFESRSKASSRPPTFLRGSSVPRKSTYPPSAGGAARGAQSGRPCGHTEMRSAGMSRRRSTSRAVNRDGTMIRSARWAWRRASDRVVSPDLRASSVPGGKGNTDRESSPAERQRATGGAADAVSARRRTWPPARISAGGHSSRCHARFRRLTGTRRSTTCAPSSPGSRVRRSFQELENSVRSSGGSEAPGGNAASSARAS